MSLKKIKKVSSVMLTCILVSGFLSNGIIANADEKINTNLT